MELLAISTFQMEALKNPFTGYTYDIVAHYFVYVAAEQNGVPILKKDLESIIGNKINMNLLSRVRKAYSNMGFKRKFLNIEALAESLTDNKDFPIDVYSTFMKLVRSLLERNFPINTNPMMMIASCLYLAARIDDVRIMKRDISRICRVSRRTMLENIELAKTYLGEYEWKLLYFGRNTSQEA